MANYDKIKIQTLCDKYLETENPNDFGELLMALEPMVRTIVNRWNHLRRHHEDMVQEILMTLWKKQGNAENINKLKLNRMKRNENGVRFSMSVYFFFVIRGYIGKVGPRFEKIFEGDLSYTMWFNAENWMGNLEIDEGTKMFERGAD